MLHAAHDPTSFRTRIISNQKDFPINRELGSNVNIVEGDLVHHCAFEEEPLDANVIQLDGVVARIKVQVEFLGCFRSFIVAIEAVEV